MLNTQYIHAKSFSVNVTVFQHLECVNVLGIGSLCGTAYCLCCLPQTLLPAIHWSCVSWVGHGFYVVLAVIQFYCLS